MTVQKIVIVGIGYIGTPTAVMFASKGFEVVGIDINKSKVDSVNRGECHIEEPILPELLKESVAAGKLMASMDFGECKDAQAVIICVETPLKEDKTPGYVALKSACSSVSRNISPGTLVIVESTISPGTSERIVIPALEEGSGMQMGDFLYAHCPETVIPGNMVYEMRNNHRVIGGYSPEAGEAARKIYSSFVEGELYLTDHRTAEVVKVIENTYRDVNIGFANELALASETLGVDIYNAIEIANHHPRVHIHSPGAGVGGHCIPKDPWLLMEGIGGPGKGKIMATAREVNEGMPEYFAQRVYDTLATMGVDRPSLLILGTTYKKDSDDMRESPAIEVIKKLKQLGVAEIECWDPYMKFEDGKFLGVPVRKEKPDRRFDCLVLITDHSEFSAEGAAGLYALLKKGGLFCDGRGMFQREEWTSRGFAFFGLGRG